MNKLLDTCILIDFSRGNPLAQAFMDSLKVAPHRRDRASAWFGGGNVQSQTLPHVSGLKSAVLIFC